MVVKLNFVAYYSMIYVPKECSEKVKSVNISQFKKWMENECCTMVIGDGVQIAYNEVDVIRWLQQVKCSCKNIYFLERYMDARKKSNYRPDIILEFEDAEMETLLHCYKKKKSEK